MGEPKWNKRSKLTGKGGAASFISMPHYVLNSDEFAALTGNELRMLMELARQYKGNNNGDLTAMREQLVARGWKSHQTIDAQLAKLERKGWIVKTRQGGKRIGWPRRHGHVHADAHATPSPRHDHRRHRRYAQL